MDSPADQPTAQTKSSPQPQSSLRLKQKLKPLELAKQLADYVDKLSPVAFSLYDNNPQNPYSLPEAVGAVFVQEGLLNEQGQVNFSNLPKLNKKKFTRQLKNKISFVIINNFIKNSIYTKLNAGFDDPAFMPVNLHDCWLAYSEFIADYYAPRATAQFYHHRYPDRLTNTKVISRLPIKQVNQQLKKDISLRLKKDQKKITDTVSLFLTPNRSITTKKEQNLVLNAAELTTNIITAASEYYYDIAIKIDPNRFPLFDITYTQEI